MRNTHMCKHSNGKLKFCRLIKMSMNPKLPSHIGEDVKRTKKRRKK
jgi:hypothetical protein